MKEIKVFIHRNRVADVLHSLKNNNFCAGRFHLSINDVSGTLKALDNKEQNYSIEFGEDIITEVKLELICDDEHIDEAVALIRASAQTGQSLAGWIYIYDITKVLPIEI